MTMAPQAFALSCTQTGFDVLLTAEHHQENKTNVIFVKGRFDRIKVQKQLSQTNSKPENQNGKIIQLAPIGIAQSATARFTGVEKTANGDKPIEMTVNLKTTCVASWCGGLPKAGKDIVAVLSKAGKNHELVSGPCAPNHFANVSRAQWQNLGQFAR